MKRRSGFGWLAGRWSVALVCAAGVACSGGGDDGPPDDQEESLVEACPADISTVLFDRLPVAASAINEVIVFGELDPGGDDVIPNSQSGIRLNGQGVPLVAPGNVVIVGVRSSTFTVSPFRQGETDFGLTIRPCSEATATFLHVTTLEGKLADLLANAQCSDYSTDTETVHDCKIEGIEVAVTSGEALGTVGGATAGGFDFDMHDERSVVSVTARAPELYKHAVCFSRYYDATNRALLESRTGLLGVVRDGDPACGTIEVDVAGAAQGVWVKAANPVPYEGNADDYLTLAPHFLDPDNRQDIAIGGSSPILENFVRSVARTNRDFEELTEDGLIYCYSNGGTTTRSYFLRLNAGQQLTLEVKTHAPGVTPCLDAPGTWAFSGAAVGYVR